MVDEYTIFIIGAGGHAKELDAYIRDLGRLRGRAIHLAGFIDDFKARQPWGGSEIIGGFDQLEAILQADPDSQFFYITAVGQNRIRAQFVQRAKQLEAVNLSAWTLQHPDSQIGYKVEIGEGTCLAPGTIVTTHVEVGRHCILNTRASVSHDCAIGDFVNINPGAVVCGNVKIGDGCYVGAGATIIDGISIGEWSVIGAGAVVINDIPPHATAVGVPAKVIKENR